MLAFELHQTPERLRRSKYLDHLVDMSPGCAAVRREWAKTAKRGGYDLPPALRKG